MDILVIHGRSECVNSKPFEEHCGFSLPPVLNNPNDWNHTWGGDDSDAKLKAYLSELVIIMAAEESLPNIHHEQNRGAH